mmetsp:Transcript_21725/g.33512  ORF Transcript_21725/g.33512 Transcript_21725/m.33512 type:complete len:227 (+) Transcript_21725:296-976(+)
MDVSQSEAIIRASIREMAILRHLSSLQTRYVHVTQVREALLVREDDGKLNLFMIMEYYRKGDLERFLKVDRTEYLNKDGVLKIIYSLLCALKFMHSAGIVHRDIHPKNLLVTHDCKVVLCDFGLGRTLKRKSQDQEKADKKIFAHFVSEKERKERKKRLSIMSGTMSEFSTVESFQERKLGTRQLSPKVTRRSYRPPEIIVVEPTYSSKVDIWSAGCVVSEIITCS